MSHLSIQQMTSPVAPVTHSTQTETSKSTFKLNCLYVTTVIAVISVIAATVISIYVADNCTTRGGYFISSEAEAAFTASLFIAVGGGVLGLPSLFFLIEDEINSHRSPSQPAAT